MTPKNPYVDGYARPGPPVYLPFRLEHAIMTCVQRLLEETCFHFAERWIPELLKRQGWDIPEAGELNHWWKALKHSRVPDHAVKFKSSKEAEQLFTRLHQVRHAAVHRLRTDAEVITRMLQDALRFAVGFDDNLRRNKFREIQLALLIPDFDLLERIIAKPLEDFQTFNFGDRPVGGDLQENKPPKAENDLEGHQLWPKIFQIPKSLAFKQAPPIHHHPNLPSVDGRHTIHPQAANQPNVLQKPALGNTTNKPRYSVDVIDLTILSDDETEPTAKRPRIEIIDLTGDSGDEIDA